MHEIRKRSKSDHGSLITLLDVSVFQIMCLIVFFFVVEFSHICGHEVVPS